MLVLLLLLPAPAWSLEPAAHLVVVSLDTTRADHFGFLGNERVRTPHTDALSAESIVFSDYLTVAPSTLVSHTSLFTGLYAHHHGTPRNGFVVNPANEMLAERLRTEGFRTVGFAGNVPRFDSASTSTAQTRETIRIEKPTA